MEALRERPGGARGRRQRAAKRLRERSAQEKAFLHDPAEPNRFLQYWLQPAEISWQSGYYRR